MFVFCVFFWWFFIVLLPLRFKSIANGILAFLLHSVLLFSLLLLFLVFWFYWFFCFRFYYHFVFPLDILFSWFLFSFGVQNWGWIFLIYCFKFYNVFSIFLFLILIVVYSPDTVSVSRFFAFDFQIFSFKQFFCLFSFLCSLNLFFIIIFTVCPLLHTLCV